MKQCSMKYSNIGGQAVMEGVMMRNGDRYAVAVRTQAGDIAVKTEEYHSLIKSRTVNKIPLVRGVFNFVDSLVLGMSSLMYSAEFFAEETEQEMNDRLNDEMKKARRKAEKLSKSGKEEQAEAVLKAQEEKEKKEKEIFRRQKDGKAGNDGKEEGSGLMMGLTVAFSLIVSISLFMMLPYFLSRLLHGIIRSEALISIAEAVLRMAIFFGYLLLISQMKDIQRVFMYHGAEHKCINCIEHGLELNVENVRKSSREHKRCGTSFLLFVMIVSVIFFLFIRVSSPLLRIGIRILLIPVIAGVSYELIRFAGRSDNAVVRILSKPGMMLQHLTTREPDDSQIEVGIASVEAIFDWRKYLNENFGAHYELTEETDKKQTVG